MGVEFRSIVHVQLAIPAGGEAQARQFWVEVMGFAESESPAELAARGNRWFVSGPVQVHVGVDPDFHPARKAHPALALSGLDALVERLGSAGVGVRWAEDVPGVRRCHTSDPFGNRIELMEA